MAYALLTVIVCARSLLVMEYQLKPRLHDQHHRRTTNVDPAQLLRQMRFLVTIGLATFITGFVIWNLDNIYCNSLIRWRHRIGLPAALFLEGHGWWHILTGIGGELSRNVPYINVE